MVAWQSIGRGLLALFYAAPWAWLLCFAAFTAAATYVTGHVPSYGNPDPKQIDDLWILYTLVVMWLGLTLLSPFVVAAHAFARVVSSPAPHLERQHLLVYALGATLVAYIIVGDPAGLATWLWD
ncbi:hypothetical protein [uncultured Hyphomicrobium sp.]|uniref:hypothetical protein n=1 Tax=uncultured Hyphomicrobium sp. TaxID=194373 RepID=UPI0025CF02D2|nr:hypothetical protein [uncultured Hyphomicrobium sp.]